MNSLDLRIKNALEIVLADQLQTSMELDDTRRAQTSLTLTPMDVEMDPLLLVHGWTVAPLLFEFVGQCMVPLAESMTAAHLAAVVDCHVGPLAVVLQACCALGYLEFNDATSQYTLVPSADLREVQSMLARTSPVTKSLRGVYQKAAPPFWIPSVAADFCLDLWQRLRPAWKHAKSRLLSTFLDGVLLVPLLTSMTYVVRWDDAGVDLGEERAHRFDFSVCDGSSLRALQDVFLEAGLGTVDAQGSVSLSSGGQSILDRVHSFYLPASNCPLLANFRSILYSDASWGFGSAGREALEREVPTNRTLSLVGCGEQLRTVIEDVIRYVSVVFGGEDFESQPRWVADLCCGDAQLLVRIHEHVRDHLPRGRVLDKHPLQMVGVDRDRVSLGMASARLRSNEVPHTTFFGDASEVVETALSMRKHGVNPEKTLFLSSLLHVDRLHRSPTKHRTDSALTAFTNVHLADAVHLNQHGVPVSSCEVFASLVEHFERWSEVLGGTAGLLVLQRMRLDRLTTAELLNQSDAFHFNIIQSLSRQYTVTPCAFALATAMVGLLPVDFRAALAVPEQERCEVRCQHLRRRKCRIRLAERSDLPALARLEHLTSEPHVRVSRAALAKRLETAPTTNLVAVVDNKIVAVLYMQRVATISALSTQKFIDISETHRTDGKIAQMIALASDPSFADVRSILHSFTLFWARLDTTIESVVAVVRPAEASKIHSMKQHALKHAEGLLRDPSLGFHTDYGAEVVRVVEKFFPEDVYHSNAGVLVQYQVKSGSREAMSKRVTASRHESESPTLLILKRVLAELGHDTGDVSDGMSLFELGVDSSHTVTITDTLAAELNLLISPTDLVNSPTIRSLAKMLDERRGVTQVGENQGRISKPASPQRDPHHSSQVLTFDILQSLMADLGFDIDEECKAMSFFELGVTSSELTLITDTLATALQMDLPATMLMDYPVVQDLMIMLDSKRGIGEGEFPRGEGRQPDHIMESEACATKGMWDLPADAAMQGRRTQEWQRGLSDNEQEGPTSGKEDDKEYFNALAALYARLYGVVSPTSLGLETA